MDAKAACLFLTDAEKNVYKQVAQTELFSDYFDVRSFQVDKLLDAMLPNGYLCIRNATMDPRLIGHSAKKVQCIASALIVPIICNNEPFGVLFLYSVRPKEYSKDEIEFLTALADLGSIALMNINLIERIMNKFFAFSQPYLQNQIVSGLKSEINGIGST